MSIGGSATRGVVAILLAFASTVIACSGPTGAPAQTPKCIESGVIDTTTGPTPDHPHEPSGFTEVTDLRFNAKHEDGWAVYNSPDFSIVVDSTAPDSTSRVGQALFPAGFQGDRSPVGMDKTFSDRCFTRLYVSFWVKISANWQSHTVGNKIGYMFIHNDATAFALFVPGAADSVYGSLHSQMRLQATPDGAGGAQNLPVNVADVPIVRGKWQHWEIMLVSNTGNKFDGTVKWWIDGKLAGDYERIRFGKASQSHTWQKVSWRPVWGGGPPQTVRQNQYMWMDEYYVSGRR